MGNARVPITMPLCICNDALCWQSWGTQAPGELRGVEPRMRSTELRRDSGEDCFSKMNIESNEKIMRDENRTLSKEHRSP